MESVPPRAPRHAVPARRPAVPDSAQRAVFCQVDLSRRGCGGDLGPRQGCTEDRMYSTEQRKLSIETYIKFDLSAADTIAELGYPTRHSLRAWYKDYLEHGEVRPPKRQRKPKFTLEMRRAAMDCQLAHGRSLARTMRRMGHSAGREYLCDWIDELAPGQRKYGGRTRRRTLSRLRRRHRRWSSSSPAAEPPRRSPPGTACRAPRPTYSAGR